MATRCNIKIIDDFKTEIWFYRHYDGSPEVMLPFLNKFLDKVKEGKLRANASQSSGWLVIMGWNEYGQKNWDEDWKVGSIEPTDGEHGDISYLYIVDLTKKEIQVE